MDVQHGPGLSPWQPRRGDPDRERRRRLLLIGVRYVVPALIILAGLVEMVVDSDSERGVEIGCMAIGAGIAVAMLNFFFRMGVSGDVERDREEDARAYFDEHGRWPDEAR